jgi:DNA mismatch endonuclease (patch repair protein)
MKAPGDQTIPPAAAEAAYRPKTRDEIARNMAAIRSKENKTERELRQLLHRRGLRFRKYRRDLPGNPDIVFPSERVAVFVDGDYWHSRILRERGVEALLLSIKNPNVDYWATKFKRNVSRDDEATLALQRNGWRVLRYWESDVKRNPATFARRVALAVEERRSLMKRQNSPGSAAKSRNNLLAKRGKTQSKRRLSPSDKHHSSRGKNRK